MNCMWMVVIDSYSKWLEVVNMRKSTTAESTIRQLRILFSRYGLCKILVSDNAPQLVKSTEFERYCRQNGINHIPIPSYHPASNGAAESSVNKFKSAMRKMCKVKPDMELNITSWLINYHNTPHSTTGVEPSVLMMGRRLRSPLSLVHPLSCSSGMRQHVREATERLESEKTLRRFEVGDSVLYRDVLKRVWLRGTVVSTSDKVYEIEGVNGATVSKHIDHVVASTSQPAEQSTVHRDLERRGQAETVCSNDQMLDTLAARARPKRSSTPELDSSIVVPSQPNLHDTWPKQVSNEPSADQRPTRLTKAPTRLNYDKLGG